MQGSVRGSAHRARPRRPPRPALRQRGVFCRGSVSHLCLPVKYERPPWLPRFLARMVFLVLVSESSSFTEGAGPAPFLCPRQKSVVSDFLVCLYTSTYMVLPAGFSLFGQMYVFFFSSSVLCLGVNSWPFSVSPPFFVWGSHTRAHRPLPPLPDPFQGPLVSAQLTSTSSLRAKPSARQPQPDWQGSEAWRGGPGWETRPLIGVRWSPASAESLTRSRARTLGADAGSCRRTRSDLRNGHVHPGLVAPPGARGPVGVLDRAHGLRLGRAEVVW